MEKHDVLMNVIFSTFPLFSPSMQNTRGLTIPIHSPNNPLTRGPKHINILLLRRRGGETFTGLFHRMQPLQPILSHH